MSEEPKVEEPNPVSLLKESRGKYLGLVLKFAGWIGEELKLHQSLHYRPNAILAEGYRRVLLWRLAAACPCGKEFDINALMITLGVKPGLLRVMLRRDKEFMRAAKRLRDLLESMPADVWIREEPVSRKVVRDWLRATETVRECVHQ